MSAKATLASQLEGKVLTPGDDGYEESLKRWASNFEKRAEYVVYVKSLEDISKTVLSRFTSAYQRFCGPRRTGSS